MLAPLLFVNLMHDRRLEIEISRRRMVLWTFSSAIAIAIIWSFLQRLMGNEDPKALFGSPNAYSAFLASLCDRRYTATQYALLTSLMAMGRVVGGAPTGRTVSEPFT